MNRLTHQRNSGIKTGYWSPNKKEELVTALAAYEDTGLTPEDIMELKEFCNNPLNTAVPAVSVLPEKPLEEKIKDAIKLLRANEYIVKKWTPAMKHDADECERMDDEGESKDCCGCACSVCLAQ